MNLNKKFIIPGIIVIVIACFLIVYAIRKSGVDSSPIIIENVEKNVDDVYTTLVSGNENDDNTISGTTNKEIIKPTNQGELIEDEKKKEEMIEAFKNSKYSSCDEIISDYIERLEALKKGNMKPFGEFPISTDPTIKYCQKTNAEFRKKLDSLENIGNEILAIKLKEFN